MRIQIKQKSFYMKKERKIIMRYQKKKEKTQEEQIEEHGYQLLDLIMQQIKVNVVDIK